MLAFHLKVKQAAGVRLPSSVSFVFIFSVATSPLETILQSSKHYFTDHINAAIFFGRYTQCVNGEVTTVCDRRDHGTDVTSLFNGNRDWD